MDICEGDERDVIRLIATDLDDTLLDAKSALTERTLAALKAAMAVGCGVAISSGRMLEATLPFARAIGVNAPMLIYNGAMLYDPVADEALYARRVPYEVALSVVKIVEAAGSYVQLYPGKGYYCEEVLDRTRAYERQINVPVTAVHMPLSRWLEAHPGDLQKLLIIDSSAENADRLQAELRAACPRGASFLKSKPHYIEVMPEGVDKGAALRQLAELLGLVPEEVMAFGDGQNDVPMLRFAGAGYAMANASCEVRACTPNIAPPNTDDGVAQVIERYLAEGRLGPLKME